MVEEKVVVASGYFDPLHVGHLEYLKKAKALGGKLVVIVNNEKQTVDKKGYEFMSAEDRVEIIKSLGFVDEVVISSDEDESICKSLEKINPHVFAKGGDRFAHEIPEAELCRRLGIEMVDSLGEKIRTSLGMVEDEKEFQKSS